MGIPGLLRELNALVGRDAHISTYSGKRVAIDASGWLHRACYSCALELLQSPSTTTAHLSLLRSFLSLLLAHDITPTLVFDGAQLPAKANTAAAREANRLHHRTLALQYLHSVPANPELAQFHAQKAMTVTGDATARFIALARDLSINYVVAPYEADAQLAWLMQHSLVDACVTEDSDLVAFGCDRIFIRLERSGQGREIVVSDLVTLTQPTAATTQPTDTTTTATNTTTATTTASTMAFLRRLRSVYLRGDMLGMCVLSGCDYLPSLRGVGLRTAAKWWDDYKCIEVILLQMKRAKTKATTKTTTKRKLSSGGKRVEVDGRKRKWEVGGGVEERKVDEDSGVVVLDDDEGLRRSVLQRQPSQRSDSSQEMLEEGGGLMVGGGGKGEVEDEDEETVGNQGKEELYDGYALDYHKAILSFRHQLVYDTRHHCYCHLNPLPPSLRHLSSAAAASDDSHSADEVQTIDMVSSISDSSQSLSSRMSLSARHDASLTSLDFLGSPPPAHLMHGLVTGTIDPRTLRPYDDRKLTDFFSTTSERREAIVAAADGKAEVDSVMREERSKRLVDVDRAFFAELLDADIDIPSAPTTTASSTGQSSSVQRADGSSGSKRPMSRVALERERRSKEERRSTGGGLLRFFSKTATVTAIVCSSAAPT